MELTDYRGVMRRWSMLVVGGTFVAALVGLGLWLRDRGGRPPRYVSTAIVLVRYVVAPGDVHMTRLDVQTETELLSEHVHDRGALERVAAQAHVALSQVQQVSNAVDPEKPLITVRVLGRSPQAVAAVAQGMAEYLVRVETQRVQAQAASLSPTATRAVAQAQQRWLAAQAHYYLVCGCIASQHHATVDPATLARLRFALHNLRSTYLAAASGYTALQTNAVSVALVLPGTLSPVTIHYRSSLKALLPAAVLGFLGSVGLAMLLDVWRTGRRPTAVHVPRA